MNRKHLTSTALFITAMITGAATVFAAEGEQKLPQTLTVKCSLDAYAFKPTRKSWHIDQLPSGLVKFDMTLKRQDRRMPFGSAVPGWTGSKTMDVKGGYTLRVDAHYMIRRPKGDFIGKPSGLTLDVLYFYRENLIGYSSVTSWSEEKELSLSTSLTDTAYVALMHENGFKVPSQFSGYANGFRYWAAVRDGLNAGEKGLTFDTLSGLLGTLGRENNLMMPAVTLNGTVTRPAGSDIPAADTPSPTPMKMRR